MAGKLAVAMPEEKMFYTVMDLLKALLDNGRRANGLPR
jgi:hypothetical protein